MSTGNLNLDSRVVASRDHMSCNLDDEVVLLSLRTGEYYGLNVVAASIWNLIQQPQTIGELRDVLLIEYEGISPEECVVQVIGLLNEMIGQQLVEIV